MSIASAREFSEAAYGLGIGRGDLERHVLQTLRDWIVAYIADYERQQGLAPRSLPVPPVPESIHGSTIDFETFSLETAPELIVVVQPSGRVERFEGDGGYGSWYAVSVAAICSVEGSQDDSRGLADAYGSALQKLLPQQGNFGYRTDGTTDFATRTRLRDPYGLAFPDESVRDIVRATVVVETFLNDLVADLIGPLEPPRDPYAVPEPIQAATEVEVALIRGTPDDSGPIVADAVILDGTVYPPVIRTAQPTVNEPADPIPSSGH